MEYAKSCFVDILRSPEFVSIAFSTLREGKDMTNNRRLHLVIISLRVCIYASFSFSRTL